MPNANITQPAIKNTPPIGVIGPKNFKDEMDSMYNDPEKRIIPLKNIHPDIATNFCLVT